MADEGISIEKTQTTLNLVLLLVVVGAVGYVVYQIITLGKTAADAVDEILQKFGIATDSGGMNQPSSVPGNKTVAQSAGGYDKLGASGQMWSCSGPSGSPQDMCTPVNCDANGNCTATGAAVPASQAN
jgi:hypothetical protein